MRDVDPRLLLDPIIELCLPKIWQWTDYDPSVPGYWDMICDFIALVAVRLINGTEKIQKTTRNKPMHIREIKSFMVKLLKGARIDKKCFDVFVDITQTYLIVDYVCGKTAHIEGVRFIKEDRKYGLSYFERDETVSLNHHILTEIPELDIRPAEDSHLADKLKKESKKLKTGETKTAGLSPLYSIFSMGYLAQYEPFWYKKYDKDKKPERQQIMEEYGCFIRYLIRKFKGFPSDLKNMLMANIHPDDSASGKNFNKYYDTPEEGFEHKLLKNIVFDYIESRIKCTRYEFVNIFELEYNFLAQGPFFIDKELILSCIDKLHDLTIRNDDSFESKYLLGMNQNKIFSFFN